MALSSPNCRTKVLSRTIDALDDCCFFVLGCEATADSPRAVRAGGAYRLQLHVPCRVWYRRPVFCGVLAHRGIVAGDEPRLALLCDIDGHVVPAPPGKVNRSAPGIARETPASAIPMQGVPADEAGAVRRSDCPHVARVGASNTQHS